jgi:ribosomal protein S18 acetylase RimI-like enzyme
MHTIEPSHRHDRDLPKSLNGRIAEPEDRALVTEVLTRAFHDDPVMQWTLRDGPRQEAARRTLIDATVGHIAIGLGHTYILEDGSASAAWVPPAFGSLPFGLRQASLVPPLLSAVGLARVPRLLRLQFMMTARHPRDTPHYYLFLLGVDPAHQGRGRGSVVMARGLERVDQDGVAAYLENSNPRNTAFYRRFGFQPWPELRAEPDAPPLQPMWRPARGR